jgi:hypothetical protein
LEINPGKLSILTLSTGPKLMGPDYYAALHGVPTSGHMTSGQGPAGKEAQQCQGVDSEEEARKAHHFRVLTSAQLWEAVRAAHWQATAKALTLQYARPAAMKRGLTVYGQVQARTKTILDMITEVAVDPAKLIVIALGWKYKGARAHLGDRWTPVCKAVLDVLERNFMVVLIDEYLTSQMCHDCHNKMVPARVTSRKSTATTAVVMWIAMSTLQEHFGGVSVPRSRVGTSGLPVSPNQHQGQVPLPAAVVPQTAEV